MTKLLLLLIIGFSVEIQAQNINQEKRFEDFIIRFLGAYWKQYPDNAILYGYDEAFQEAEQLEEKYQRATLSQVQLCYYFTGATEIFTLREDYSKKMGTKFNLKSFHEGFLRYGTAPVKYIRELMLGMDY